MKKISKIVASALCGVALVAGCMALAGCGGSGDTNKPAAGEPGYTLVEDGKLTIGTDFDYPPFTMLKDGQPDGFEYGMMTEICKRIDLELNYLSPQAFDTLVTQVAGGTTMDVAVSGITINDERLEEVDFTDSYYDSNLAIVTMKDSKVTKDGLKDVKIGAQSGTSGEDWVKEYVGDANYTPYTAITEALLALRTGKVEALVYDAPVAEAHIAGEYSDMAVLETIATGEQYGIAVNKENTALKEAINGALAEMKADGTLEKLVAEYLA